MTIRTTITKEIMLADGVVRDFPFTFRAWEEQILVIATNPQGQETDVTSLARVTLHDDEDAPGGVATYPVAPEAPLPAGWKLTVARDMDFEQHTDIVTAARFQSSVIEETLDKLTAQDQEMLEGLNRAVKVPISSGQTPEALLDDIFTARDEAQAAHAGADAARNAAAASAAQSVNAATQAVNAADSAAGVVAAVTAKLDGMIGLINNFYGMAMECCGSLEDYRYVHEDVTEDGDYGLVTEAATKTEDWGGLKGLLA
jgi:nucleoid-associated protein YgaU